MDSAPDPLTALTRGATFPPMTFHLERAEVEAYLDAVGDRAFRESGLTSVPPVAAAAFALRALLATFHLPDGSVHTGEEVDFLRPLRTGEALRCESAVTGSSDRAGYRFSTVEQRLLDEDGQAVLTSRAMLMSPLTEASS